MAKIRLAVIGLGNMGLPHVRDIKNSGTMELACVCDVDKAKADRVAAEAGVRAFYTADEVLESGTVDGVVVATPHYDHTPISIAAMKKGIHVLVEKPIAVHAADAKRMIEAYGAARKEFPGLIFSAMFMQRTYGYWKKIKELIDSGELGRLVRTTWIITNWFRTQYYYDTGGWRATWKGEGGGVLLNQCPHNLDLYQWLVGMPSRVSGFAHIGKYHNIEVEDEVTAYFEHDNGMVGHFITTTAESPGTNRLEIVGEKGKLVFEDDRLTFSINRKSMFDQIANAQSGFAKVECWDANIPYRHHGEPGHRIIIENFVEAINGKAELIAPAPEGINSVSLGNAIMLSSFTGKQVSIPIDAEQYEKRLKELIASSTFKKREPAKGGASDMASSYN